MRAMTFERLVRDERFVSQLLTTAVGALGLERPAAVRRYDGAVSADTTAAAMPWPRVVRWALNNCPAAILHRPRHASRIV